MGCNSNIQKTNCSQMDTKNPLLSCIYTIHGYKAVDEFTPISGELIGEW